MANKIRYLVSPPASVASAVGRYALFVLGASQAGVLLLVACYPGVPHGERFPQWLVLPILLVIAGCGGCGLWARCSFPGKVALCLSIPIFIGSAAVLSQRTAPGVLVPSDSAPPGAVIAAPMASSRFLDVFKGSGVLN